MFTYYFSAFVAYVNTTYYASQLYQPTQSQSKKACLTLNSIRNNNDPYYFSLGNAMENNNVLIGLDYYNMSTSLYAQVDAIFNITGVFI